MMNREHERQHIQLVISSNALDEIKSVREVFANLMRAASFGEQDIFRFRLATEEALMNAVKHGNGFHPKKRVRIAYAVEGDQVSIKIEDEGHGFCVDDLPDPRLSANLLRGHGRGVLLMRTYSDTIEFNERGNCVTMRWGRSQSCSDAGKRSHEDSPSPALG